MDLIIGNQDKLSVLDYVIQGKNERPLILRERIDKKDFSISFAGEMPYNKRANLKIQDGCDFMCSFCIIPFARGRARSRDFDNLLEEARSLAARGVRELILTGVNIGTYNSLGRDILPVIDELDAISGIDRIRISSIEPTTVPLEIFERMRDPGHALLPFLHLPLQSGSDKILRLMRRKYSVSEYTEFIQYAFRTVPGICIGTDLMAGFPGETEEDFEETCRLFLEQPLVYCHVFPYSERDGTPAARRTDSVPVPERNRRCARLRRLSAEKRHDFQARFLDRETEVLFEDPRDGLWPGYTPNYIRVLCESPRNLANRRARVRLARISADFVEGTVAEVLD